jgi:amino acid transporter
MLTFISFWRAAAIVLCDLGSSAYYVGGISEQAVGRAAPWFILAVMCFSYAIRAVYIESCVMFVRGGVYRVVKTALGGTLAKLSVSALMFDFVLTGPVSGVSAGQYLVGLLNDFLTYGGFAWQIPRGPGAAILAILVTVYFWRKNIKGIHESSDKALRIMQVTTVMVVLVIVWCTWTLVRRGVHLPPWPLPENLTFSDDALGWLRGTDWPKTIGLLGIMIAFGHSILSMSGFETLAQVNREIAYPKVLNLKRAGLVIFLFSLTFTSLVSFFSVMIIPDAVRPQFFENLIGGLAMNVEGPYLARLMFQVFVAVVGFLVLSGAVNTAILGSNGVLNRVSEDGVLSSWFRRPHNRYGTSYRIINLVTMLQITTIAMSRGNVYVLGEAYAFGLVWSFFFNALSMLVLRFKQPGPREYKVPLNFKLRGKEIPLGMSLIILVLLATALVNLVSKEVATISGLCFAAAFFTLFQISEHYSRRKSEDTGLDQFQLIREENINSSVIDLRTSPVLVTVRDHKNLRHLETALSEIDTTRTDVVVMTARIIQGASADYEKIHDEHLFTDYEQLLFTRVVARAEKMGKPVKLLTVPSNNPFSAMVNVAIRLGCSRVYVGASEKVSINSQARMVGKAWEEVEDRKKVQFELVIVPDKGGPQRFQIGAHTPTLLPEDVELTHKMWLDLVEKAPEAELHHRDVVSMALRRLQDDLRGPGKVQIVEALRKSAKKDRSKRGSRRA